tara:strand:+ start:570 stop:1625 length:1056 start_codon:yes stop_codon:yes gene_type:complete
MIPLFPNVGFVEISSAGTINDAMGSAKSQLPIQFFRLSDNISGNLTIADDASHKKIILDTNGKTITNSSGAPITNNSSTTVEIKGSGNIQSTLKTFTLAVTSNSNTGTSTFSNSDSSTVVVSAEDRTADISASGGVSVASGFGGSMSGVGPFYFPITELLTLPSNPGGNTGSLSGGAPTAVAQLFTLVGGSGMPNLQSGAGFSVNVDGTVHTAPSSTSGSAGSSGFNVKFGALTFENFGSNRIRIFGGSLSVSAMKIPNNVVNNGSRLFTYTNNLATSVILSGDNPFDDITVSAGATATFTRTSTDGSFNITGTVSGNDSDSQPFVLTPVNNGTGDISTTAYTGTLSASAL